MFQVEKNLRAFISGLPDIQNIVTDPNSTGLVIGPRGEWSYEKLGRLRSDKAALAPEIVEKIAGLLTREINFCGEWMVHCHLGVQGYIVVFERRPTAILERMSHRILRKLTESVRHQGDGLLLGPSGASKSSILCWLAGQTNDEPLLLVSEIPPSSLPGKHVRHVFPPKNDDRRSFERLLRISPVIFWDKVRSRSDLETLLINTKANKRWFTIDIALEKPTQMASEFSLQFDRLLEWGRDTNLNLKTIFSISQSSIGRPEPQSILKRVNGEWKESFRKDDSFLNAFKKIAPVDVPPDAIQKMEERTKSFQNHTGIISQEALNILTQSGKNLPEVTRQYSGTDVSAMEDLRSTTHINSSDILEEAQRHKLPNIVDITIETSSDEILEIEKMTLAETYSNVDDSQEVTGIQHLPGDQTDPTIEQ